MSGKNISFEIKHVTRVEGHGNIVVDIKNGQIKECRWDVPEAPRFFEAMVLGKSYNDLAQVTSRICGICSIGHTLASLKATEAALGIKLSPQTIKLRKLLTHAENFQSHVLHVGYLVLPDLMGVKSVVPLASSHPKEVLTVVKLHALANEMSNMIGGRTTHPQRAIVGGFSKLPKPEELKEMKKKLLSIIPDLGIVANLVKALAGKLPDFVRETEFIALTSKDDFALYDGDIASTDGGVWQVKDYKKITNEYLVPNSTAKYTKHKRDSYMVGALARLNLNAGKLSPKAKEVAGMFNFKPVCHNPYVNSVAQVVETVHSVEDSIKLIDEILSDGIKPEKPEIEVKAGRGAGAVEVPRGILFHEYEYDKDGNCVYANCIIPTGQNHANIQKDFEALLPKILNEPQEQIALKMEMLVRAYDPCISCSTHYLKVKFV
jgi:coenzyme F420-reducing hydrogenase alpha subunit